MTAAANRPRYRIEDKAPLTIFHCYRETAWVACRERAEKDVKL